MNINQISSPGSSKACMLYHEDPAVFHVNTLGNHCYFIPFKKGPDAFKERERSGSLELLNGRWGFCYYDSLIGLPDNFAENKVEVAILETGMGGRFDATNVIKENLCSVITQIDLDHTDRLGKTKNKIAFEKKEDLILPMLFLDSISSRYCSRWEKLKK